MEKKIISVVNELLNKLDINIAPFLTFTSFKKCSTSLLICFLESVIGERNEKVNRTPKTNTEKKLNAKIFIHEMKIYFKSFKEDIDLYSLLELDKRLVLKVLLCFRDAVIVEETNRSSVNLAESVPDQIFMLEKKDDFLISNQLTRRSRLHTLETSIMKKLGVIEKQEKLKKKTKSNMNNVTDGLNNIKADERRERYITDQLKLWADEVENKNLSKKQLRKTLKNIKILTNEFA